ncbi:AraC family transcriptional regulator [Sphingomonas sp. SRS2]|uniref:AraC family transcriptional regulator n=1 Tax=Sphingomonas sp. SRS2 TaxID=133190 RepID=UPI00061842FE|nr:helix-turn-helix transcriptional regulator [Sphingomonas sp. SRS2]KKC25559.1 AraC family transcriptional regulator [Sphingomonas sp. SRS2]
MKTTIEFDESDRSVIGLEDEYEAGFVDPTHQHGRDQILYASAGVMSVTTARANFVIPPQRAIWIPANVAHEVACRGPVSLRTLYLSDVRPASRDCRVLEVTDLLRALIVEVSKLGGFYENSARNQLLIELLKVELGNTPLAHFQVPMPHDYRLLRVCRMIIADPAGQHDLNELASLAGMGRRSFTRAFRAEMGMSLAIWRQQVRLMRALTLLSEGQSVTTVAFDVGYDSPSAFTTVFHRAFGVLPSQYQPR